MKSSRSIYQVCMNSMRVLTLSLTLALIANATFAQSFHIGLKAGTDLMKITGRSFDGKIQAGFSGGAYAEINVTHQWGLQPELLFSQVLGNTNADFNGIYQGVSFQGVTLNYIQVPVLIAYKPVPELSILLGPQYGYLVNQTTGLLPQMPNKDAFKKSEASLVFGGQLNLSKFKIGARYKIGLTDINGINDSDQWKDHGFQFYLGYRLF